MAIAPDYRVYHSLAESQVILGAVQAALENYDQALATCPDDNQQERAAILHNSAEIYAQQGEVQEAIELYQQSLALYESIGNVQGKAVTLANMAYLAGQQGDTAKQLQFNVQAAELLGQMGAFVDLVTVLSNLGTIPSDHQQAYLAQALWLALRVQLPFAKVFALLLLFHQVPQGDPLEPLLAITAGFLCASQNKSYPDLEQLQQQAWQMLGYVAQSHGIETQEALYTWMAEQQLTDSAVFLPHLLQRLEEMVGDTWLFDARFFAG